MYFHMYVIEDFLRTSTQNGNEVVTHITHMIYERKEGHFKFHTLSRRFVYRWHITMQSMRAWKKLSNDRRSMRCYSIKCGHDSYVYRTNLCAFINSFYSHCHDVGFSWSIKLSVDILFLHRLMAIRSMYNVYRQYTWYLQHLTLRQPGRSIE